MRVCCLVIVALFLKKNVSRILAIFSILYGWNWGFSQNRVCSPPPKQQKKNKQQQQQQKQQQQGGGVKVQNDGIHDTSSWK